MKKQTGIAFILTALVLGLTVSCGEKKQTRAEKRPSFSQSTNESEVRFDAVQLIAGYMDKKDYAGDSEYYTSDIFKTPDKIKDAVLYLSNRGVTYIRLLRGEILARHYYRFKKKIFQTIFNFTFWYDQKKSKKGEYKKSSLNRYERENLRRLRLIEEEGYALDWWDEPSDEELAKIKREIEATRLDRAGDKGYHVEYYFMDSDLGVDYDYTWRTNLQYIGEVKELSREELRKRLAYEFQSKEEEEAYLKQMKRYKNETKKQFEERMKGIKEKIAKMREYEREGGMLIPQGAVIYNTTGRKYRFRQTSTTDPKWLGVYAPIEGYQEGQQKLYSYDATVFGSMSVADPNYVQLGTPKGSVFYNTQEGFMEYVYEAGGGHHQFDKTGRTLRSAYYKSSQGGKYGAVYFYTNGIKKFKRDDAAVQDFPEIVISADFLLNYDVLTGLSWGVSVDLNKRGYKFYFYGIYKNLRHYYGYWYYYLYDYRRTHLTRLWGPPFSSGGGLYTDKYFYGSLLNIGGRMYAGNALLYHDGKYTGRPAYFYVESADFMLGESRTNEWGWDKFNKVPEVNLKGKRFYPGVPSFYNHPYAYDWSVKAGEEDNLWIDIYPIEKSRRIRRIRVRDLKIGKRIKVYVNGRKDIKRKLKREPEVRYIRYIGDDREGLLYFAVGTDMEDYDGAPLLMAINRDGELKLLLRLRSAAGDVSALLDSARMGSSFYDYRAVVCPDNTIFEVWNGSKGVGVGKFEVLR